MLVGQLLQRAFEIRLAPSCEARCPWGYLLRCAAPTAGSPERAAFTIEGNLLVANINRA
jgi:hypothetical protein